MAWIKFVWVNDEDEDLVMEWTQELGWSSDPFEDGIPDDPERKMVGYTSDRSKINLFIINKEKFGVIRGEDGTGKTMLLRWLFQELHLHNSKVIPLYLGSDWLSDPAGLVSHLAEKTTGFFSRLLKRHKEVQTRHDLVRHLKRSVKRRRLIFLLDNIDKADKESVTLIKQLVEEHVPLQVIVAGRKKELDHSPLAKLGTNHLNITLSKMTNEEARDMVRKRIEDVGGQGLHPFTQSVFDKLVSKAGGNPRNVLKECRKVAIKSSINKKMTPKKEEEKLPAAPKPKKSEDSKFQSIKEKIATIDYVKGEKKKKKKKPDVEVVESKKKRPSDDEYADVDEKEKNDKLISELFEDD